MVNGLIGGTAVLLTLVAIIAGVLASRKPTRGRLWLFAAALTISFLAAIIWAGLFASATGT